jgi:hypothetical protein
MTRDDYPLGIDIGGTFTKVVLHSHEDVGRSLPSLRHDELLSELRNRRFVELLSLRILNFVRERQFGCQELWISHMPRGPPSQGLHLWRIRRRLPVRILWFPPFNVTRSRKVPNSSFV